MRTQSLNTCLVWHMFSCFTDMSLPSFGSSVKGIQEQEDPAGHGGRIRSYPHERGQWTVHVHTPGKWVSLIKNLTYLVSRSVSEDVCHRFRHLFDSESKDCLKSMEDFHMSLFRGHCTVRFHHIPLVVDSLTGSLSKFSSFDVVLNQIKVFENDIKSTKFIAACDARSTDSYVKQLVDTIHQTLSQFVDLKTYDEPFTLHSSLLWFNSSGQDNPQEVNDTVNKLQVKYSLS